ncbi:MAG: ribose transport system permease protein [Clostridium sp.]|jgi:ribose transport system permease protein
MSEVKTNSEKSKRFEVAKKNKLKTITERFGPLLGLILLCLILAVLSPDFVKVRNIMNIANQSSINCLISMGMLLTILTAGIDLSVGSILALSTCVMGIAIVKFDMNPLLGILICLGTGAFCGLMNGVLLTKLRLPHPFISTLAMKNVARGLALIITMASPISGFPKTIQYFGSGKIGPIPISFVLVIVVCIGFYIFLNRTAQGRHIYAVGGNKEAAALSGVNVDKTLVIVYTLCGVMAALAGVVMVGRVNSASPLGGLDFDLDAIAACIIGGTSFMGGVGTVGGTLIGAMIMAVLRNGLNLLGVSPDIQIVAIGLVIIAAVYVDVIRSQAAKKVKVVV